MLLRTGVSKKLKEERRGKIPKKINLPTAEFYFTTLIHERIKRGEEKEEKNPPPQIAFLRVSAKRTLTLKEILV